MSDMVTEDPLITKEEINMDNTNKIMELMQNDAELQNELMHCTSKSQAVEAIQKRIPDAAKEDIDQAVKNIVKKINEMQNDYLRDEESDLASDKNGTTTTAITVTTITAAASSYAFM